MTGVATVFTWGATLVALAVLAVLVAAFFLWWRYPNRERREHGDVSPEDRVESRERLDLLRTARRWGDISTTDISNLTRH